MLEFLIGLGLGFICGMVAGVIAVIDLFASEKVGTWITLSPSSTEERTLKATLHPLLQNTTRENQKKTWRRSQQPTNRANDTSA